MNKEVAPEEDEEDDAGHIMSPLKVNDSSDNGVIDFSPYCNLNVPDLSRLYALLSKHKNIFSSKIRKMKVEPFRIDIAEGADIQKAMG
ncbi:unnamed protein product [Sphagnum balticum]